MEEVELIPESLSNDWKRTLAQKKQPPNSSRVASEEVIKLDGTKEREVRLHIDAEEIHEGVQLDGKADPLWEPWQAKKPENTPVPNTPRVEEAPPVAKPEELLRPSALDPTLTSEALLHSQAVANIAKERAQVTPPSYKDQLPKEAQDIMDRLQPAKDHHIEQSAWHNIEVDNKTGKAVEQPSFSYGEAFQDEQRTEANDFHNDGEVATASGQLAVSSPLFNSLNDKDVEILGNSPTPAAPMAMPRSQVDSRGGNNSSIDPLLWTILVVIVIAIFLALII